MSALRSEPVRAYGYSLAVSVLAILAAYGVVSETLVPLWLGLASAGLAVPAVEGARSRVTPAPPGRHERDAGTVDLVVVLLIVVLVLLVILLVAPHALR